MIFSETYDDVYFARGQGLAEKRHVFLGGNNLPARWAQRSDFVIAEAGFGTGLSFLVTAKEFLATTPPTQHLYFYSFEKHPLTPAQITDALSGWAAELGALFPGLTGQLPVPIPGFHRLDFDTRVHLTLIYGDMNDWLPHMDIAVDAWFLDGFTPAKNPGMWGQPLFDAMRKLSAQDATAATYSAARVVKDGLAAAGFHVEKAKGFGYKSDMITARFAGPGRAHHESKRSQTIAVLGGGFAGTSVAWALKRAGHNPVIIAPNGLADGGSGNPRGLYNPRPTKQWSGIAHTHATGWARLYHLLSTHHPDQTGWIENGTLHLCRDPDQTARLLALMDTWGWGPDMAQALNPTQASDIAGIQIQDEAVWLPSGGSAAPGKICALYATDIPVRPDMPEHYDGIVIATGAGALTHPDLAHLPLKTVRGQISYMRANDISSRLKTNLCYGGYLTPADHGVHVLGATFQHWLSGTTLRDEDHIYVQDKLHASVGPIFTPDDGIGGRASLRVTSKDHAPLIGRVHTTTDIPTYVSVAHGSHGLITTHLGAHMIADAISHAPSSVPTTITTALSPNRFKID